MHNAAYAALGLAFTYVPFGVTDLPGAIRGMRALGIRGFGVSMPYKLDVMQHLDAVDPLAAQIGAVNTVVNDDGRLTGFNTDALGAVRALREARSELQGARILLIGAGGAARAVGFGLRAEGAVLRVVNRTRAKAEALAGALGASAGDYGELSELSAWDAVVNCSSVGMSAYGAAQSPIAAGALRAGMVVMDIVYKPMRTRLVTLAEQRGARVVHGGRMLLHQAMKQFELYTGRAAPAEAMEQALAAQLARA
jgi:shikimate dehydrogenase